MNLERFMTQELGELGKKIHTGRSRNDLIASTLRLFVHDEIMAVEPLLLQMISAIQEKSRQWIDVLTPGMTHMQFGQPLRFGHLFSAHGFAMQRDLVRLAKNKTECLESLPLGAAAFAGTHLKMDLKSLAESLGFAQPLQHSYDAVSDRDYMLSTLQSYALLAMHLSRYCEDVLFWSSSGIKVLKLPYEWSTGSSIMPNKRNPDVPELVRAKMARVMSAAQEGLTLMRSVTPSYGSDIHELKRTFINATSELKKCLTVLSPFTQGLSVDENATQALLNKGHILATDVANHLATTSTFREAYVSVASAIKQADEEGQQIHQFYKNGIKFDFETSIESRSLVGGTSRKTALEAIEKLSPKT
jgi:argininosuccinate lyase